MDDFYAARDRTTPPLSWPSIAPPITYAAVGLNYQTPVIDRPLRFVDGDANSKGQVAVDKWWLNFGDDQLNKLVVRGMVQNLDVRTANERVKQEATALRATGQASQISGDGSVSSTTNSGDLAANYVFDILGGVRRGQEQAAAELDGAVSDVGTARLASLVGNYIDARYYQEAMALTRDSIATRRETVALTRQQQNLGVASELDSANAEVLLNEALANLPALKTGFCTATYGIATLLSEPAGPITKALWHGSPQPRPKGGSATGVSADRRRGIQTLGTAVREMLSQTLEAMRDQCAPNLTNPALAEIDQCADNQETGADHALCLTGGIFRSWQDRHLQDPKTAGFVRPASQQH